MYDRLLDACTVSRRAAPGLVMCTSSFLFEKRRENRVATPIRGRKKCVGADAPEPAVGGREQQGPDTEAGYRAIL